MDISGNGDGLFRRKSHPYIGKASIIGEQERLNAIADLNKGRDNKRKDGVEITYYFELITDERPGKALRNAGKMILDHGTVKPWSKEGDAGLKKPAGFDEYMSWACDFKLLGYNGREGLESGIITIAYPMRFFDKRGDGNVSMAQFLTAVASEPFSAFSFYQGAKIIDLKLPAAMKRQFPGQVWPNKRVREYLRIGNDEPIIGTIVKPKTGLTPELFSRSVVEAALAGARFTKADENMHLALKEIPKYVGRVVKDLTKAGFDLGRSNRPKGRRFLFAPHITSDPDMLTDYARAAVEAGANALMFSPYFAGGFLKMAEIVRKFDVPVYAHTAGMNVMTGSLNWGFDPRVMYLLSASFGAAFMQITTKGGYLRPMDEEKEAILQSLKDNGLDGDNGMTLAIAGGLGPANIGYNIQQLGGQGRMFLAGSSVYSHPDGPSAGVKAILLAYQAYRKQGITGKDALRNFARGLGDAGLPLLHALA
ncbi:MAG: RuBisCO large subunit C-terminal-like domain-containing protein [Kiritimatiellaeota bacterium]|nr:RuBisCO large subunit C-terminal-like domain-containing protein [Kiritimatiellota bacterium]